MHRRYVNREPVQNFRYRLPGQGGKEIYRMGNSVPYYDRNGDYQGRRGVSVDITAKTALAGAPDNDGNAVMLVLSLRAHSGIEL
jgi:hypothetical protein